LTILSAIAVISDSRSFSCGPSLSRLWALVSELVLGGAADACPSDGNAVHKKSATIRIQCKAVDHFSTLMAIRLAWLLNEKNQQL